MGAIATPDEVRAAYAVDEVGYVDSMAATLKELDPPYLHTLDDFVNSDSGRRQAAVDFPGVEAFRIDGKTAWPVLCDCRVVRRGTRGCDAGAAGGAAAASQEGVLSESLHLSVHFWVSCTGLGCFRALMPASPAMPACSSLFSSTPPPLQHKTPEETEIMRYACAAASRAHVEVMRAAKAGLMEYQLESKYLDCIYAGAGCRTGHYTPIFASGPNGAVLHYGHAGAPNGAQFLYLGVSA